LSSRPVSAVRRSASSFATGKTPGKPRQTGQTRVLGGAPNSLAQPHHIFDLVFNWTCVSRPMTASYSMVIQGVRRLGNAAIPGCGFFGPAGRTAWPRVGPGVRAHRRVMFHRDHGVITGYFLSSFFSSFFSADFSLASSVL